jgi:RNA polymerase sigma-70 factor, ECF subfamily
MDRRAVEQLYVRFGPMVLRRALGLVRSEHAAKDVVQEVFVRALRSSGELAAQASPGAWLYRVTTNYCLNLLRDEARRAQLWSQYGDAAEPAAASAGEMRVHVAQVLRAVSPELQEIAFYYLVDELKQEEIAELVGVSRRTIGNRIEELRVAVRALETVSEAS